MTLIAHSTDRRPSVILPAWLAGEPVQEFLAAFSMLLPLLFTMQLGSLGPALFLVAAAGYGFIHLRWLPSIMLERWPLLLIPLFFLASALWSDYPAETIKYGLEIVLTVGAALILSASPRPRAVMLGLFAALAIFLLASVALGKWVTMGSMVTGDYSAHAFGGLNGSKNLMGAQAGIALLASLAAIWAQFRRGNLLVFGALLVVLAASTYALVASKSAGSLLGVAVAVAGFFGIMLVCRLPRSLRGPALSIVGVCVLVLMLFAEQIIASVTSIVLEIFNKDPTLTGRSYLWYRAQDFIAERPLLGRGYNAFWIQGNIDAEGLWQYGQITNRFGFNFHNTKVELLVHVGLLGALLVAGLIAMAGAALLRRLAISPSLPGYFYFAYLLFMLARTPYESLIPSPVEFSTVILFAGLGFGYRGLPSPEETQRPQRPDRRSFARPMPVNLVMARRFGPPSSPQPF